MSEKTSPEKEPLISVIIPTYNREKLIQRAVKSALGQRGSFRLEVLVMDDGSTDGTSTRMAEEKDPRVRYFALPHGGACAARNRGICEARGEYLAFLDSDDLWHPEKLEMQIGQLEESRADVVSCAFMHCEEDTGERFVVPRTNLGEGQVDYRLLLKENFLSTQTLFGKASCLKQVLFDESFPRMQDWDYVIRLARDYRVFFFPTVLAEVYVQTDSITRKPELGARATRMLLWKYREDYFASEPALNGMLDTIAYFTLEAADQEINRQKLAWEKNEILLRQTEMERDYYKHRVEAIRHPLKGIRMAAEKLFRGKKREKR